MSTELALRGPQPSQELTKEQVTYIAHTSFVPKSYRGKVPEIFACILTGRALGLDDMTALRWIYVIDGTPTLYAEAMVALVRRDGHSITGKSSSTEATVTGKRADNGDEVTVVYTIEDAKRAGLVDKANWKKHPEDMVWSRAVSRLCRRLFPECLGGVSHTPEEMLLTPEERNTAATEDLPLPADPEEILAGEIVEDSSPPDPQSEGGRDDAEPGAEPPASAPPITEPGDEPLLVDPDGAPSSGSGSQTSLPLPDDVRRSMERE